MGSRDTISQKDMQYKELKFWNALLWDVTNILLLFFFLKKVLEKD